MDPAPVGWRRDGLPDGVGLNDKTHIIGALCRAWPQDAFKLAGTPLTVVVTPSLDIASKNYADLKEMLPRRNVGLICSTSDRPSDDIQVVTPESMQHVPLEECGLLIYDEVHTFTWTRAEHLGRTVRALRFGFSATPTGRFDGSDQMVSGFFGPVVYSRTYRQAIEDGAVVPIKVIWVNCPRPDSWPENGYQKRDASYRNGLWRNTELHQIIKDVVAKVPEDVQLLTVVDKIEHMNNLLPYLEGFTAVHAEKSDRNLQDKGFANVKCVKGKARQRIYDQVADNKLKRIISTGVYRQGVNFKNLTVLINAEGMGSEIIAGQLPGRASRNIDGKSCAYIIDFYRSWDIVTNARGRTIPGDIFRDDLNREKIYTGLGFDQVWVDSVDQVAIQ